MLVRIFGAEGMIDRDVETSTFASLAAAGHTPPYYGRFANGRLEGWMGGMRPLEVRELSHDTVLPPNWLVCTPNLSYPMPCIRIIKHPAYGNNWTNG